MGDVIKFMRLNQIELPADLIRAFSRSVVLTAWLLVEVCRG